MLLANIRRITELSVANRLPGVGFGEYAEDGGLLAYGVSDPELWRRAPIFVDKILKGTIVNLKTANALGLTIPPAALLRADQIIE
jgi:putative ABC transport system substrate-binding protein